MRGLYDVLHCLRGCILCASGLQDLLVASLCCLTPAVEFAVPFCATCHASSAGASSHCCTLVFVFCTSLENLSAALAESVVDTLFGVALKYVAGVMIVLLCIMCTLNSTDAGVPCQPAWHQWFGLSFM